MTCDPDLPACPFCGKSPAIIRWDPSHPQLSYSKQNGYSLDQQFSVACVNPECPCHPQTKISPMVHEVVELWSQRVDFARMTKDEFDTHEG